jgi:nucleoside-diphosphate-sugar epimerase
VKISIIGANSLLAKYIFDSFVESKVAQIKVFARTAYEEWATYEEVEFFPFSYPEQPLPLTELLESDVVIYCAAAGVQANVVTDTDTIYAINAFLPIKVINYLSDNGFLGKFISFGSYFEIGDNDKETAFSETMLVSSSLPIPNKYCSSKRLLTKFIAGNQFAIEVFHLILPTIYGSAENSSRLIPYLVTSLIEGRVIKLSAGSQVRQYIHCKDVVSLVSIITNGSAHPGIYNVAASTPIKIASLVKSVFSYFNQSAEPFLGTLQTRDESMKYLALDNAKIASMIPEWHPQITLEQGIAEYLKNEHQ